MQEDTPQDIPKADFEDVEFAEINPEEITSNFSRQFEYTHRKISRVSYYALVLYFIGFLSMIWFLWIPAYEKCPNLYYFFHSVPFFFFLTWTILAFLPLPYFLNDFSHAANGPYQVFDQSKELTIELLEFKERNKNKKNPKDHG